MNFSHLTSENGLSQNGVNTVMQDRRGFIWLGTQDGLNRYDGHTFKHYYHDPADKKSLSNSYVYSLLQSRSGDIWVGTLQGLNRIDAKTGEIQRYYMLEKEKTNDQHILSLHEDARGRIWAMNLWYLFYLEPGEEVFKEYKVTDWEEVNGREFEFSEMTEDSRGRLITGGWARGLITIDTNTLEYAYLDVPETILPAAPASVTELFCDSQEQLWIATWDKGMLRYNPQTGDGKLFYQQSGYSAEEYYSRVLNIAEADNGILYMACKNRGLLVYDPAMDDFMLARHNPDDPVSLIGNDVSDVLIDATGSLWVATAGMGVSIYSPTITFFDSIQTLEGRFIYAFAAGEDETLYVGGYQTGLYHLDKNHEVLGRYNYDRTGSIDLISILTLFRDCRGRLWVGTSQSGLLLFDIETNRYTTISTMGEVRDVFEDHSGNIWCVTDKSGLWMFGPDTEDLQEIEIIGTEDGEAADFGFLKAIEQDADGDYWLATHNGVVVFRNSDRGYIEIDRFYMEAPPGKRLLNNQAISLLTAKDGSVYIGTRGGLALVDNQTGNTITFSRVNGLPNNVIYSLTEDDSGRIWYSTNRGLGHFDPVTGEFKNYFLSSGLQGMEFNTHAAYKDASGRLYFGGVNGANYITPSNGYERSFKPMALFSSFKISGEEAGSTDYINSNPVIVVDYARSSISFSMAINDYRATTLNRYAYRIDGLDDQWHYMQNNAETNYHNLLHGTYFLRIKGANGLGQWSSNESYIKLIVTPPFYQTSAFQYLLIALGLLIIISLFIWRASLAENQKERLKEELTNRTRDIRDKNAELEQKTLELQTKQAEMQELNKELESFSYTVSHDLQAPLNTIRGFLELIEEDSKKAENGADTDYFRRIERNLDNMGDLIQNLLKFSRSGRRAIELQSVNLSLLARECAAEAVIQFNKEYMSIRIQENLTARVDEFLMRIALHNLLHNALKYSQNEKRAEVEFGWDSEREAYFVRDNGVGFDPAQAHKLFIPFERLHTNVEFGGSGIGLATVKKIIERHGGSITVESNPGEGATFWFTLPEA